MLELVMLLFATFWAWETLRYVLERFAPRVFDYTRAIHPLLVAALPVAVLWPHWVAGLAVAGATGLVVGLVDRFMTPSPTIPVQLPQRRTRGGLPPLP